MVFLRGHPERGAFFRRGSCYFFWLFVLRRFPEHFPLSNCATRTARLELLNHAIEIGIACAPFPCEPVPTSLGDSFAVRDHLELTGLTRRNDRVNTQAFLDEGRETRDLDLVVLSRRAVNDFYLHEGLQPLRNAILQAYTLPPRTERTVES